MTQLVFWTHDSTGRVEMPIREFLQLWVTESPRTSQLYSVQIKWCRLTYSVLFSDWYVVYSTERTKAEVYAVILLFFTRRMLCFLFWCAILLNRLSFITLYNIILCHSTSCAVTLIDHVLSNHTNMIKLLNTAIIVLAGKIQFVKMKKFNFPLSIQVLNVYHYVVFI